MKTMADVRTTKEPLRRALGLALVLAFLLAYAPEATGVADRLLWPLLACVGAWLVTGSLAAVALAVAALTAIHTDFGSADPIPARVYPAIALLSGGAVAAIFADRFAARIRATRAARTAERAERTQAAP